MGEVPRARGVLPRKLHRRGYPEGRYFSLRQEAEGIISGYGQLPVYGCAKYLEEALVLRDGG